MEKVLQLEFDIFVMMAVGFGIRKIRLVGEDAERVITNLVLYIILPCNIFSSFASSRSSLGASDFLAIFLLSVAVQILSVIYGRFAFRGEHPDRRCSLAYAMICSNAGFLGNAISEGVFGAVGLMLTGVYLIPQRIMMWSEGLVLYTGVSDRRAALGKALRHPCLIACLLGVIVLFSGLSVPDLILAPVQQIGRCSTPLTMIMIGMILSHLNLRRPADKTIVLFSLHRLVLMPLAVWLLCLALPVSRTVAGVSVLMAAMPAGATTTMLAARYGRDPDFATRLVVFTTLCSIPTIFIWSLLVV